MKKTFTRSRTIMQGGRLPLHQGWTKAFRRPTVKPCALGSMPNLAKDTEIMNSYEKILVAAILLLGSSSSAYPEAGWTNSGYVQEVQATTSGVLVAQGKLGGNPSGCRDGDSYYADYSLKGAKEIFSLLLQSIATKNRVKLFVTGRCDLNGMSEISAAAIHAE